MCGTIINTTSCKEMYIKIILFKTFVWSRDVECTGDEDYLC